MTQGEKLLVAAVDLEGSFSPEDLAVRAWELWPETFSAKGLPQHIDTHKVYVLLSSKSGPVKKGEILHAGTSRFRLANPPAKELPPSNVIDYGHPLANMYGCLPCPKCGKRYRFQVSIADRPETIVCDECQFVELKG